VSVITFWDIKTASIFLNNIFSDRKVNLVGAFGDPQSNQFHYKKLTDNNIIAANEFNNYFTTVAENIASKINVQKPEDTFSTKRTLYTQSIFRENMHSTLSTSHFLF